MLVVMSSDLKSAERYRPLKLAQPFSLFRYRANLLLSSVIGARAGGLQSAFWAIVDQALFALSNFGFNLALARWLPSDQYGAYAFILSIFLYVVTVHSVLFIQPAFVFVPGRFKHNSFGYIRTVLSLHAIFIVVIAACLLSTGLTFIAFGRMTVGNILLGVAFSGPTTLSFWLMRQVCYILISPRLAARSSLIYLLLLTVAMTLLGYLQMLSILAALSVMVLAGSAACSPLLKTLLYSGIEQASESRAMVLREHFNYGRWGIATAAFGWIPGSINILLLPVWADLSAAAGYRALEVLLLPLMQTVSALSVITTVRLARWQDNRSAFRSAAVVVLLSFGILGAVYSGLLMVVGRDFVHFVYAGRYDDVSGSIFLLAPSCIFYSVSTALGCILQSIMRPDLTFKASAITAVAAALAALCLIPLWGIGGAALSWTISTIVSMLGLGALGFIQISKAQC